MILVIDIGNTNTKFGVFDGKMSIDSWRVSSDRTRTADEYGVSLCTLLANSGIDKEKIEGVIISSVIPSLNYTVEHMCKYYLHRTPIMVGPGTKTGLNIKVDNPREVGADRIVNCVAAYKKYGGCIVIDFGTATTFNILTRKGEFVGGVISPGIKSSMESLVSSTAQLPRIELERPSSVLAKNTTTNMQAGIVFGFAGLVDYLVKKIRAEMNDPDLPVIATGGLGELIAKELDGIKVDRTLTLDGLRMLYEMNTEKKDLK